MARQPQQSMSRPAVVEKRRKFRFSEGFLLANSVHFWQDFMQELGLQPT